MNKVYLQGKVTRIYKGAGVKGPFVFLSVAPNGSSGFFEVSVFGDVAGTLADVDEGNEVSVLGRLGAKKDKKLTEAMKKDVWVVGVVVDGEDGTVIEKIDARPKGSQEDIAF